MTNEDLQTLLSQGIMVNSSVSADRLISLAKKFAPWKTEHSLIRLGPMLDGGYLVPDDLLDISACFSPGVSHSAYFEEDLKKKYNIGSHLVDFSVEGAPHGFVPLSFTKKFIGSHNSDKFITLENWVKNQWEYELNQDFMLQMDIEGAEYESILSTPDSILKKFRIIIVEVHELEAWGMPQFYKIADAFISKLLQHFIVVHNHPNNWGGKAVIAGVEYPRTIEITLHRKDRCKKLMPATEIPHFLDAPCGQHLPDFTLSDCFRIVDQEASKA